MAAFLRKHWFSIAIPTTIGLSYTFPDVMRARGTLCVDQWKDYAVMTMFLCSGVGIPGWSVFRQSLFGQGVRRHVAIQAMSLVGIPVFVWTTASPLCNMFELPEVCARGAAFTACLPTTIGLGIAFTRAASGDVLLATFHSAVGNAAGPFIFPFTSRVFADAEPTISIAEVFKKLTKLIVLPLLTGAMLRRTFPQGLGTAGVHRLAGTTQQICLLVILSNVFSNAFAPATAEQRTPGVSIGTRELIAMEAVMALYHVSLFVATALLFSKATFLRMGGYPGVTAGTFAATQKTAAMGIPLLDLMLSNDPDLTWMVTMLLLYHMTQIVFGGLVAPSLLRRIVPL